MHSSYCKHKRKYLFIIIYKWWLVINNRRKPGKSTGLVKCIKNDLLFYSRISRISL